MSKYRNNLPQESKDLFITDGGLETTMIFDKGYDLPEFAAFDLLSQPGGYEALRGYYLPYIDLAKKNGVGFILESATWRASRSWGRKIGYDSQDLKKANQASIALLEESLRHARQQHEAETETVSLAGMDIAACNHCNWCIRNQTKGKYCTQDDDMSAIYPRLLNADGIVLATPVHWLETG